MRPKFIDPLRACSARLLPNAAFLLFLVHLSLVYAFFIAPLSEINPWDEAAYLQSGRELLRGGLPSYAFNPLVALFYALLRLPFQGSPYWMVFSVWIGRFLLFCLLWFSAYRVARALGELLPPAVALGFLFVTPLTLEMLRFPSDPLFAGLAGLALAALLRFQGSGSPDELGRASVWLGLAALARNDGLVLFPIFLALAAYSAWRRRVFSGRVLISIVMPFLLIVGGYVLLRGVVTGSFALGTAQRTYDNFEAGQQVVYSPAGGINPVVESKLEARRLFGGPEENRYNVFVAIRRNPGAYLERLRSVVKALPWIFMRAYGQRFALLIALLGLRGLLELIRSGRFMTALTLLLWPAHLATGLVITLFRPGHLQFPFYVVFALAGLGLWGMVRGLRDQREPTAWGVLALILLLATGLTNKMALFYSALVFFMALLAGVWVHRRSLELGAARAMALLIFLLGGVVLHGEYPSPEIPTLGQDSKEQAASFMMQNLPPGSRVAAGSPGVVWAAELEPLTLASMGVPIERTPARFLDWLREHQVRAIYVDHTLYNVNPAIWALIEPAIGKELQRVFVADEGDIQVLLFGQAP